MIQRMLIQLIHNQKATRLRVMPVILNQKTTSLVLTMMLITTQAKVVQCFHFRYKEKREETVHVCKCFNAYSRIMLLKT